ncbi:ABC transporter substrate-binding protein [Pseudonocardia endophytica]|uniref:Putative aliphatic sulfonates-binding protein n=1 Tax=Pseudonocardia endophytica TaxID=401976 RepID=A0A4V2PHJ2_PSEEN|nr:ABC transporter substrate-binding protein [Pseudonocardia endophytica]TCK20946.1 sulfonate transport system substrate-binding protein [Pseudonocardia endophytica]
MRPLRLLPALAAVVALALAGCSAGSSPDAPGDAAGQTLRFGDQAGQQQALLEASGVLAGTPYQVEFSQFPAAAPLLEALRGEAVDIGVAGDSPTLNALGASDDISIVSATRTPSAGGLAVLVPPGSPIRSVADLRGKRVSPTTQGSIGHYLLLQALREAGIPANEVQISFLQPVDAAAAFRTGAIDAWSTWDPYTAVAQQDNGARVVRDNRGLSPGLSFLDANNDSLDDPDKRAAMTDFVARYARALEWAQSHPDELTAIYAKLTQRPPEVAKTIAQRAQRRAVPLDATAVGDLQGVADNLRSFGVLRQDVQVAPRVRDLGAPAP